MTTICISVPTIPISIYDYIPHVLLSWRIRSVPVYSLSQVLMYTYHSNTNSSVVCHYVYSL